jgi:hypothetical protein
MNKTNKKNKFNQLTEIIVAYAEAVINGAENAKTTKAIASDLTGLLTFNVTPREVQLKIKPLLLEQGISVGTSQVGLFACQNWADFQITAAWYNKRMIAEQRNLAKLADNFASYMKAQG